MKSQKLVLLSLVMSGIISGSATYAADPVQTPVQTFATKNQCISQFYLTTGKNDAAAAEVFCKNKIKSDIEVCADKKLLDLKVRTSVSSVDEPRYAQKFRYECKQTAQASVAQSQYAAQSAAQAAAQVAQQQQAHAVTQQQASAAAAAKRNNEQKRNEGVDLSNLARALAPVVDKVGSAYDNTKKDAKTAKAAEKAAAAAVVKKAEAKVVADAKIAADKDEKVAAAVLAEKRHNEQIAATKSANAAALPTVSTTTTVNKDKDGNITGSSTTTTKVEAVAAPAVVAGNVAPSVLEAQANVKQVQADKVQADKVQADKVQADKVQAEKVQADKVQADKVQAEKVQADKVQADKVQADIKQAKEKSDADNAAAGRTVANETGENVPRGDGTSAISKPAVVEQRDLAEGEPLLPELDPAKAATAVTNGETATPLVGEAAKKLATDVDNPAVTVAAQAVTEGPEDAKNVVAPVTEISADTKTEAQTAKVQTASSANATGPLAKGIPSLPLTKTVAALTAFNAQWLTFTSAKKGCLKMAETSGFLCIAGTSPGTVAARTLIDVAGPVIALAGSAQKACSNTASMTDLVGKALLVAKGICVTAQLSCSGTCKIANMKLTALETEAAAMWPGLSTDKLAASKACNTLTEPTAVSACVLDLNAKLVLARTSITSLNSVLTTETPPTPGTAVYAQGKCNSNVKDIVLFGVNIIGVMAAKKNADECAKSLETAGDVSPTQYCESPANVNTQFCKCKKDNTQQGCSGYLVDSINSENSEEGIAGINLKNSGALNSFAGGSKTPANTALGSIDKKIADADKLSSKKSDADTANASSGQGSNGAGGSSHASGSDVDPDSKAKKKWSFSDLASSMFGGSGGSGGSGGKASKKSGNASLNSSRDEAIQRRIASDKQASEVSSASGKSNWEKIRKAYLIKENTLLSGQ